jgi:hypothetical protein
MKKLRLDLDSVVVESFAPDPPHPDARHGTVEARDISDGSCRGATCGPSCPGVNTNCVCNPDTYPNTWWENCMGSGDYSCEVVTGGCECPTIHVTNCRDCSYEMSCF